MTFLEFVTERLLGPPIFYAGKEARWECPMCGKEKLHCRYGGQKDRVACWACDFHEDAPGLWMVKNPGYFYRHACEALEKWQKEWEQLEAAQAAAAAATPGPFLSRGTGGGVDRRQVQDHPLAVAAVWANLTKGERAILILAHAVMQGVHNKTVSLDALARYCLDVFVEFEQWKQRVEEDHYLTCDDPNCTFPICRPFVPDRRFRADQAHLAHCNDPECQRAICVDMRATTNGMGEQQEVSPCPRAGDDARPRLRRPLARGSES